MPANGGEKRSRFDEFSEILKALSHPVRLMIVEELLKNPRCVTAIHELLDVRQPNISQHLNILRNAGIVASDRDGAYRCYYLKNPGLVEALFSALFEDWPEVNVEDVKGKFRKALSRRLAEHR